MGINNYNINEIKKIDKDNVIVTISDIQTIPSLSKYILMSDLLDDGKVYLKDYPLDIQNKIFKEFMINYNYIEYIDYKYLINYTKFDQYWHSNLTFQNIFTNLTPDYVLTINDTTYKYYDINHLQDFQFNYLGYLFMNQYVKLAQNNDFYIIEYDNFTDVILGYPFEMETNLKDFFVTQLTNFLKMNFGDVFGFYDFGSNLQKLIQTKNIEAYYEASILDIKGFISDINILYGNFIELKDIIINNSDYKLEINIIVIVERETLNIQFIKNY